VDPAEKQMRIREAQRRLVARRRRVGVLRSRAIAVSILCFALLWAVVFVQMATGNDPVLGAGRQSGGAKAVRPENRTDSEEAGGAGAQLAETVETTSPEEEDDDDAAEPIEPETAELEAIEREAAELEAIEAAELEAIEAEPEPVPVETAQS
jgi:cytoskeletal protein RodZ